MKSFDKVAVRNLDDILKRAARDAAVGTISQGEFNELHSHLAATREVVIRVSKNLEKRRKDEVGVLES